MKHASMHMFGIMSVAQEFPPSLAANRPRIPESGAAQTSYLELRQGGGGGQGQAHAAGSLAVLRGSAGGRSVRG